MICLLGRRLWTWAVAAGLLFIATLPASAQPVADESAPVRSLIVRLKDAPPHERLSLGRGASARERALATAAADGEGMRWRRVVGEVGLSATSGRRDPALRPVGRDQQLLTFEKPLSRAEADAVIARLRAQGDVDWVDVNSRERRLQVPNDPFFADGSQWWLKPVSGSNGNVLADRLRGVPGFQTAWLQAGGTGGPAAAVAVLDTGITPHPDLAGRILPGYDFVSDLKFGNDGGGRDADPSDPGDYVSLADLSDPHYSGCGLADSSWHGTVISGIVAAATDNGAGMAAINWNGRVLPVRVAGKCGADVADIVDGMRWAGGLPVAGVKANPNPVRVINISFGGSAACGSAYQAAIDELKSKKGVVVVAAAGNEHGSPTRPASCKGVIGVVGLNRDGFKTHYSNFGSEFAASGIATIAGDDEGDGARWNALADPGILSITNQGNQRPGAAGYAAHWGTSFAAPIVSGAVSLMLSVNPALTYEQIVDGLRKSARPHVTSPKIGACSWANPGRCICTTTTCGAGILDATQALLYAADPIHYSQNRIGEVIDPLDSVTIQALALGPDRDPNPAPAEPSASGGGGALSGGWLAGLGLAAVALVVGRRRAVPRPA